MAKRAHPLIIPVFIPNLGCPHRCSFCNQSAITGIPLDHSLLGMAHHQIETFLSYPYKARDISQIAFYGGNFLGLPPTIRQRLLKMAQGVIANGLASEIRFSTRPDSINAETLEALRPYSVSTIEIGMQTMDDTVLETNHRGHNAIDTINAFSHLKQQGYTIGLQIMIGLPGETTHSISETTRWVLLLKPDFIRIYPTIVFQNSLIGNWYRDYRYTPLTLEQAIDKTKTIFLAARSHNIPVVRMGIQLTDPKQRNEIIAGPYHPAFGHLVRCKILLDTVLAHIALSPPRSSHLKITVHPNTIPFLIGHKKQHIEIIKQTAKVSMLTVLQSETCPPDQVIFS